MPFEMFLSMILSLIHYLPLCHVLYLETNFMHILKFVGRETAIKGFDFNAGKTATSNDFNLIPISSLISITSSLDPTAQEEKDLICVRLFLCLCRTARQRGVLGVSFPYFG
jgi:hypothetical protein